MTECAFTSLLSSWFKYVTYSFFNYFFCSLGCLSIKWWLCYWIILLWFVVRFCLWILYRDHSEQGLSQWETTFYCNVVSHVLSPYSEWSLPYVDFVLRMIRCCVYLLYTTFTYSASKIYINIWWFFIWMSSRTIGLCDSSLHTRYLYSIEVIPGYHIQCFIIMDVFRSASDILNVGQNITFWPPALHVVSTVHRHFKMVP